MPLSAVPQFKIGLVLDDTLDRPDGVQQYVLTVGEWLAARGHEVHYLVGHSTRTDVKNVHSMARTMRVRFNKNHMAMPLPARRRDVAAVLARERFDVLHVQMPYSPFMAARVILAAPASAAIVGTFRILPYQRLQRHAAKGLGMWLRKSIKRFDAVVAVSQPAAEFARESFGLACTVVPNAVALERFRLARSAHPDFKHARLRVVFLGRLVERKGSLQLLRAVAMLPPEIRRKITVFIGGGGPLGSRLETYVHAHALHDCVELVGFVEESDKAAFLGSADIAVFPSLGGESFGIVLVEAMAAGARVVLGGDNPGYRSVLGPGEHQLFNPSDTNEFATLLQKYITDVRSRTKAYAWQQEAVGQYDVGVVGHQLEEMYGKALLSRKNLQ